MNDLFGTTTAATTSSTTPPTQLELAGLAEAIAAMHASDDRQSKALRDLFEAHGYDLANGDVLYHACDVSFDVPPRFRDQVQPRALVPSGQIMFTRNPRFSLF